MAWSLPFASSDFRGQRVESLLPKSTKLLEPSVDLLQRRGFDCVESMLSFRTHAREAVFAQHAQVLRNRGLGDRKLALDHLDHRTGAALAAREQLEDTPPDRISQYIERVHRLNAAQLEPLAPV
jgi:hypothetical protein